MIAVRTCKISRVPPLTGQRREADRWPSSSAHSNPGNFSQIATDDDDDGDDDDDHHDHDNDHDDNDHPNLYRQERTTPVNHQCLFTSKLQNWVKKSKWVTSSDVTHALLMKLRLAGNHPSCLEQSLKALMVISCSHISHM